MPWGDIINSINIDLDEDTSVPYDEAEIDVTYESLNPAYKNINDVISK